LHAQLAGVSITELSKHTGKKNSSTWKAGLEKFFGKGASQELSGSITVKSELKAENRILEVKDALQRKGLLRKSLNEAAKQVSETDSNCWIDITHPFYIQDQAIETMNQAQHIHFQTGHDYDDSDAYWKTQTKYKVTMMASLHKFPSLRNGVLTPSGHEAIFFRSVSGKGHKYRIFGSLNKVGDDFQIKPFSISI